MLKDFLRDDRAQATTEYILILFAALSFFLILLKFLQPLGQKVASHIQNSLSNIFLNGDLHRLPIGH